jgi:TonB family protein
MIRKATVTCSVFLVLLGLVSARGQQTYPAFTMLVQMTYYDTKGQMLSVSTYTRYDSANGDWRYLGSVSGFESATIYRRGVGVYSSNSRTQRLQKVSDHAPGCPFTTADELRRDAKFKRTEKVLDFTAFVLREKFSTVGYTTETYFVPELGRIPFKRIYFFDDGRKWVEEPISITMGEPPAAEVRGPDYPVIEQLPTFNDQLSKQIIAKPEPIYPAAAQARGVSGTVILQVVVDETGRVVSAGATSPIPLLTDRPVVASGTIAYRFAPPVTLNTEHKQE